MLTTITFIGALTCLTSFALSQDDLKPPPSLYDMVKTDVILGKTFLQATNTFQKKGFDGQPSIIDRWKKIAMTEFATLSKHCDEIDDDHGLDDDGVRIEGGDLVPEIEPNDSTTTATPFDLGAIGEGDLSPSTDFDYWTFTLTEEKGVVLQVDTSQSSLDPQLRLFDISGQELAFDDDDGPFFDSRLATVLPPGQYYVLVQSFNGMSAGRYSLESTGVDVITRLRGRQVVEASLENQGDVAFFRFVVPSESDLDIRSIALGSGLDSRLSLSDPSGRVLAENDDSGAEWDARLRTGVGEGTYAIAVDSWSGTGRGSFLFANFAAPLRQTTGQEQEPNNDLSTANEIDCCTVTGAAIASTTDRDFFRLDLQIQTRLILEIIPSIGSSLDPVVALRDSNGAEIGLDDDSGPGFGSRLEIEINAGIYYVDVFSVAATVGDYTTHVTCVPAFDNLTFESEPNDDSSLANEILFGQGNSGNISTLGDRDFYLLNAQTQIEVDFLVNTPTSNLDPEIVIYDTFGNRLYGDDDGGLGSDAALRGTLLRPAVYIVEVKAFADASTGSYTIVPESSYTAPKAFFADQRNQMYLRARNGDFFFILTGTLEGYIGTRFGAQLIDPARFVLIDQVPPCGWFPIVVDLNSDPRGSQFLTQAISGNILYDGARFTNRLDVDIR